jgi:peptidoglycan/LPS O-acetylase OafA/YrhL
MGKSALGDNSGYVPELDTFRLIAILSVMCLHWLPADCLFNRLQGQLCNGVHLFFVLSGYLITGILLRCRLAIELGTSSTGFSFRQFYIRRFLRIFPVYYFVLIVGVLFHFEGLRRGLPWHATYTSNFYYYFRKHFDGPASLFWTLAVEEQFYLLWPLVILTLPKRFVIVFISVVAVLGTACRIEALLTDSWLKILTPQCMNFLAVGSLLAAVESSFCGSPTARGRMLRASAILIALLAVASGTMIAILGPRRALVSFGIRAIDQPMMSLVFACLFAWAARGTSGLIGGLLRNPVLVYLGRISYGLYVYHLFVTGALLRIQPWMSRHIGAHPAWFLTTSFISRLAVSIAVASASWWIFEKPLNDLKRFFPYAKRKSIDAPSMDSPSIQPGRPTT